MKYKPRVDRNAKLRQRLKELALEKRRYGSPRLHWLLEREGLKVSYGRVERIYRREGLQLSKRKRKKDAARLRVTLPMPEKALERWSMDFIQDRLASGRFFRCLTIVDDFTKEAVAIEVDRSLPGQRVVGVLELLKLIRGVPKNITTDNGPEFISRALDEWAYRNKVNLNFIRPGKPTENAFIESFNGKFRDECLSENWFTSVEEAKEIIETWRIEYNTKRPHKSLGKLTPSEFAAKMKTG
jgi:putative transposase